MPNALVIRAAGTNCDTEMVRAFTLAGAPCDRIHLDRLIADPAHLDRYDLIGFPGGFSYGDDIASGRVFAVRVREKLLEPLRAAVARGACIIGACNGFQVLTQVGLLPGGNAQPVALADNTGNRFIDQWVRVQPVRESVCVWTRGLTGAPDDTMTLPIAHGEGRFVASSPSAIHDLEARGQIALRYTDNVNGSTDAIAGICDPTGRVFGLMPHPERYLDWNRHPFFARLSPEITTGDTPGLRMFKNAVESVSATNASTRPTTAPLCS